MHVDVGLSVENLARNPLSRAAWREAFQSRLLGRSLFNTDVGTHWARGSGAKPLYLDWCNPKTKGCGVGNFGAKPPANMAPDPLLLAIAAPKKRAHGAPKILE